MWMCVYLRWPFEIIHCVMFNTFSLGFGLFWKRKLEWNTYLKTFEIIIHILFHEKLIFWGFSTKFQVFKKILSFNLFDRSNLILNWSKKSNFWAKTLCLSIVVRFLLDQSKSILLSLRLLPDSSRPIEIWIFWILKGLTDQSWLCLLLSSIPLEPFLEHKFLFYFIFFLVFLVKMFKAFLLLQLVWLFYPSFFIKSHSFMHNHPFFTKHFKLKIFKVSNDFGCFDQICSMGFCSCMI